MTTKRVPWSTTGRTIPTDVTIQEALKAADLDWEMRETVMSPREFPGLESERKAVVRLPRNSDEKPILLCESVGKGWVIHDNAEIMEFFTAVANKAKMKITTAGSFRDGKKQWFIADGETRTMEDGSFAQHHLLMTNSMEYGSSVEIAHMVIFSSLKSTFVADPVYSFTHRKKLDVEEIDVKDLSAHVFHGLCVSTDIMMDTRITRKRARNFLSKIFPPSGIKGAESSAIDTVLNIEEKHPLIGTIWSLVDSVFYACDHELGRGEETRLISAWYGKNQKTKIRAIKEVDNLLRT